MPRSPTVWTLNDLLGQQEVGLLLYPPEASGGYFGFATPPPPREIFGVNALRGKQQQLGSPNLQDIFIGG